MFTPKVIDQFMGVVNHRSCSKASDPLGDMSRIDLVSKNLLANVFRNCRKRNN